MKKTKKQKRMEKMMKKKYDLKTDIDENKTKEVEKLKNVENTLIKIAIVLGVLTTACIILIIYFSKENHLQSVEKEIKEEKIPQEIGLDDITFLLPDNCDLNQPIPNFTFSSDSGELMSIEDFKGEITIITFWASWCPDCLEELALVNDFLDIVKQYDPVNYILINRLDHERETKEQAEKYLLDEKINMKTYYDDREIAYKTLGIHNIPTTFFIDADGILRAWWPKQITDTSVFEAYLLSTIKGSGRVTGEFVENHMIDEQGGVHSIYDTDKAATFQSYVLSESQGAMLEYAVLKDDKTLFNHIYNYIESKMQNNHMTSWIVENGIASEVNALIDDFRIYTSLVKANGIWGGYEKDIKKYENAFIKYALKNGRYIDFYDGEKKEYAERLTLCFGDLYAMSILAEKDERFKNAYDEAVKVVTQGMISTDFPLFYSWYNYKSNKYEEDDMNTAEAMVTLYHLAEMDMLPQESLEWLKYTISNGGIKARYSVDGEIISGYNYESTAVYALVAMIAFEVGDRDLCSEALKKMEKMRINNMDYEYNGAFGLEDGTGINSFDQIMAMLAYEYTYSPRWD